MTSIRALLRPIRHLWVVLFISILLSACLPAGAGPSSTQPVAPTLATASSTPAKTLPQSTGTPLVLPSASPIPAPSQPVLKWQEIASGLGRPVDLAPLPD